MPPVTRDAIEHAAASIAPHVRRTPVVGLEDGAVAGVPVALKLEQLQVTGSFKPRGAFTFLLSREVPPAGVVMASGGNAGLAYAYAARVLGHRATIFVPDTSPTDKIARLRSLDADVRIVAGHYPQALAASEDFVAASGALRGHAYDLPEMLAGAGTIARELEEQADVDVLFVAVGGGGLIGGIGSWWRGRVRIIGVETEGTPTFNAALAAGEPVTIEPAGIAASALGAGRIGDLAWAAREWIDDVVLVSDDDVVSAQRALWDGCRVVAEPGGAAALAGLRRHAGLVDAAARVAVLVCGANTDPAGAV